MIDRLTERQRIFLSFITNYQVEHDGRSPTLKDLRGIINRRQSDNAAIKYMRSLAVKGYISFVAGEHRSIAVTDDAKRGLIKKWTAQFSQSTHAPDATRTAFNPEHYRRALNAAPVRVYEPRSASRDAITPTDTPRGD